MPKKYKPKTEEMSAQEALFPEGEGFIAAEDTSRYPVEGEIVKVKQSPYKCRVIDLSFGAVSVRPTMRGAKPFDVAVEDIELYLEPRKLTGAEKKSIVRYFVKAEVLTDVKAVNYQIGILNILLAKYPNCSFWLTWCPGFQVRSLSWYHTGDGSVLLAREYNAFTLDLTPSKPVVLEAKPVVSPINPQGDGVLKHDAHRNVLAFLLEDDPAPNEETNTKDINIQEINQ
jgi:hypothetical protein